MMLPVRTAGIENTKNTHPWARKPMHDTYLLRGPKDHINIGSDILVPRPNTRGNTRNHGKQDSYVYVDFQDPITCSLRASTILSSLLPIPQSIQEVMTCSVWENNACFGAYRSETGPACYALWAIWSPRVGLHFMRLSTRS